MQRRHFLGAGVSLTLAGSPLLAGAQTHHTAYGQRRRNDQADATWVRYVESERQRNTMRHDLEAAEIRINTLEAERGIAACQLTQLAAVATQQAQAGNGYDLSETAIDRIFWN